MRNFVERISLGEHGSADTLSATFFEPSAPRASVLVLGAMGATQKYYADYAQSLAARGYLVATFDYRGIGASVSTSLRKCSVDISGWVHVDCATMIEALHRRLPDNRLFVVGHSLGGQVLGMIPNRHRIAGATIVASGSGYWRAMSAPMRFGSLLLWRVIAPVLTPVFGYFPGKSLRMVGDLPRGVIEQWRRWCLHPDYLWGVETSVARAGYADMQLPLLCMSFEDDEMMSYASTSALLRFYPAASIDHRRIDPASIGAARIGHFGFFRRRFASTLWSQVNEWLEARA